MNKLITINNITPIYDIAEDRIRVSINYQDANNRIDRMLTRSFLLKLLPTIEEFIYKHYPDEPIEDEVQVELNYTNEPDEADESPSPSTNSPAKPSTSAPSNRTQTNYEDLELYRNQEDLLVTINLSYSQDSKLTTLNLISKDKYQAGIRCNVDILKTIIDSIKQSVPKLQWGIGYL